VIRRREFTVWVERLPALSAAAAATASTAAAASATTTAATAATAVGPGSCFIDHQRTAAEVRAVERANGLLGLIGIGHLDECKAAGLTRVTVSYQVHRIHFSMSGESVANLIFSC
jgi:hypothetical protein